MNNKKAFGNLLAAVNKLKEGGSGFKDQNEGKWWKMEADKAGNASAKIRFLPAKDDDTLPFVKIYSHGFQSETGKWFIDDCPTTIGKDCPVCAANGDFIAKNGGNWNSASDAVKEVVRKRKRKLSYIANVLVIEDKANPDNEGQIFMFKFGQKIFDKISDKLTPQFEDEVALNPFDPVEGADFKLKMRRVEGYANFDKSEFADQSAIEMDVDDMISKLHDIHQFNDPKNFKTFEEMEKRLNNVLGNTDRKVAKASAEEQDEDDDTAFAKKAVQSDKAAVSKPVAKPKETKVDDEDESDSDLAYFSRLAAED